MSKLRYLSSYVFVNGLCLKLYFIVLSTYRSVFLLVFPRISYRLWLSFLVVYTLALRISSSFPYDPFLKRFDYFLWSLHSLRNMRFVLLMLLSVRMSVVILCLVTFDFCFSLEFWWVSFYDNGSLLIVFWLSTEKFRKLSLQLVVFTACGLLLFYCKNFTIFFY